MTRQRITAWHMQRSLYYRFSGDWAVLFEVTARPDIHVLREALATASLGEWRATKAAHKPRRIDVLMVRKSRKATGPTAAELSSQWWREYEKRKAAQEGGQAELNLGLAGPAPVEKPTAGGEGGIERLAIEIKVTRQDFFKDIEDPDKQAPWREIADRHAYAVPAGLIAAAEVPTTSGLIEVRFRRSEDGTVDSPMWSDVQWTRQAKRFVQAKPLPLPNLLDAFWRASRAEALTRGLCHPAEYAYVDGGDVEAMRLRLAELERTVNRLHNEVDRERERGDLWYRRYHTLAPPVCASCGGRLIPTRGRGRRCRWDQSLWDRDWDHAVEVEHVACEQARRADALAAVAVQVGAGQGLDAAPVKVPPPVPVGVEPVSDHL